MYSNLIFYWHLQVDMLTINAINIGNVSDQHILYQIGFNASFAVDYQITIWVGVDVADHGLPSNCFNPLAPGRSWCDFKNVIVNLALLIGIFKSSYDHVLRGIPHDLTDDKSTLVQVMAWCHQATSHYLNQCWSRSPTPHGVDRPQWVNGNNIIFKCCNKWQLNGMLYWTLLCQSKLCDIVA